ncbi:hypothetical protein AERO9AM_70617 [Aeromicrobium sp. 9AM]|nr:hypothetical protein AERO9AM_70617 [Aeromicrobium sp. 9AM]
MREQEVPSETAAKTGCLGFEKLYRSSWTNGAECPIRRTGVAVGILFRLPVSIGGGEVSHSGLVRPPAKRVEV